MGDGVKCVLKYTMSLYFASYWNDALAISIISSQLVSNG